MSMFKKLNRSRLAHRGQSLVEVIVSISITTLVLVGLVSAVTFALNNALYARNKAAATKYAQEAVEWMRKGRDESWYEFASHVGDYCLNDLTQGWSNGVPCPADTEIDDVFNRTASLTNPVADRVDIQVVVEWMQGNRLSNVTVNTYLSKY